MFCYCFVGLAFKEEGICEEEALEKFRVGEEGGGGRKFMFPPPPPKKNKSNIGNH